MSESPVLYERDGDVARIVLNRPAAMNTMNVELAAGIRRAAEQGRGRFPPPA